MTYCDSHENSICCGCCKYCCYYYCYQNDDYYILAQHLHVQNIADIRSIQKYVNNKMDFVLLTHIISFKV